MLSATGLKHTLPDNFTQDSRLFGPIQNNTDSQLQSKLSHKSSLPSFHFSEVKGHLSVGHSLLIQVAAIPPNER